MTDAQKEFYDTVVKHHKSGIYKEIDGYYVVHFNDCQGFVSANALRILADELDSRNAEWNKIVQRECER